MKAIIDGDERGPAKIAEDFGFVGEVVTSDEVINEVQNAIEANPQIVEKIKGGARGPIMSLVGKVMRATNRRSDPVVVKHLIETELDVKYD